MTAINGNLGERIVSVKIRVRNFGFIVLGTKKEVLKLSILITTVSLFSVSDYTRRYNMEIKNTHS